MKGLARNFRATSLDSLATSSNQSEQSLSDESHDSDSGAEMKAKFVVQKCDVFNDVVAPGEHQRKLMEPIPEEEPKVSVKEILARFENLKENKKQNSNKDCNNNNNNSVCINNKNESNNTGHQQQQNSGICSNTVTSNNNSNNNGEERAPVSR